MKHGSSIVVAGVGGLLLVGACGPAPAPAGGAGKGDALARGGFAVVRTHPGARIAALATGAVFALTEVAIQVRQRGSVGEAIYYLFRRPDVRAAAAEAVAEYATLPFGAFSIARATRSSQPMLGLSLQQGAEASPALEAGQDRLREAWDALESWEDDFRRKPEGGDWVGVIFGKPDWTFWVDDGSVGGSDSAQPPVRLDGALDLAEQRLGDEQALVVWVEARR